MSFDIEAACGCFCGNSRNQNEDNFYFKKKHLPVRNKGLKSPLKYKGSTDDIVMFAVFDGMGGESKGEEASCIASEVFASEVKQLDDVVIDGKEFFINTCTKASEAIYSKAKEKQVGTMGTTVAALYFPQDEVFSCNVGDSKIFRIRHGQMVQISEDHTDEKLMSTMGVSKKPVLLQYLGIPEKTMVIDPFVSKGDLQTDDYYIACSDGVTDSYSPSEIYDAVKRLKKPEDIVKDILSAVAKRDGSDNATLIIARIN